jgi:hypothetical protein
LPFLQEPSLNTTASNCCRNPTEREKNVQKHSVVSKRNYPFSLRSCNPAFVVCVELKNAGKSDPLPDLGDLSRGTERSPELVFIGCPAKPRAYLLSSIGCSCRRHFAGLPSCCFLQECLSTCQAVEHINNPKERHVAA